MKKLNSATLLLILGVILCLFCSFFLKNLILGVLLFLILFGYVVYTKRSLLISSSADAAYKKNDLKKSFELYEKAIAVKDCPPMIKIIYAYRLIHAGEASKCSDLLATVDTQRMNQNEQFNYDATRALSVWKLGNLQEAITIFENVAAQKESLLIYETLGYLLLCSRDYEKALAFNLKAYEFSSSSDLIKDNLAASYYYLGEHKKAAKLYKELIQNHATFPEPYYYYALILNEREKYKAALKYLYLGLDKKESNLSELKHSSLQYMIDQIEDYLEYLQTEANDNVVNAVDADDNDNVGDDVNASDDVANENTSSDTLETTIGEETLQQD